MSTAGPYAMRLRRYLQEGWCWLRQADLVTAFVLSIAAVGLCLARMPTKECLKLVEVVLNLAGTVLAVKGLFGVRLSLKLPPMRELVKAWWTERPRWQRHIHILAGTGGMSMTGQAAVGFARGDIDEHATLEQQVAWLRAQVGQLSQEQQTLQQRADGFDQRLSDQGEQHSAAITALRDEWHARSIELHAGGFGETLLGLLWILLASALGALELYPPYA